MKKAKEIFKSFPTEFCLELIGMSLCDVKHPEFGKHQLTEKQLKYSPAEFKNALYKNICDAIDQEAEFVAEGIYSNDEPIVNSPLVKLLAKHSVEGMHDLNRWLKYPELMEVVDRLAYSGISNEDLPNAIKKEVANIDSKMTYKEGFVYECIGQIRGFEIA